MNFDNLQYRVWSDHLETPFFPIQHTKWYDSLTPKDKYVHQIIVDIFGVCYGDACDSTNLPHEKVGYLLGTFFDVQSAQQHQHTAMDILNSFEQEGDPRYQLFINDAHLNKKFASTEKNLFFIKCLYIDAQYRKQGIGHQIISSLEHILAYSSGFKIDYAITFPVGSELLKGDTCFIEDPCTIPSIKCFFSKLGYHSIDGTSLLFKELTQANNITNP